MYTFYLDGVSMSSEFSSSVTSIFNIFDNINQIFFQLYLLIFDMLYLLLFSINFISPVSSSHQYVVALYFCLVVGLFVAFFWSTLVYARYATKRLLESLPTISSSFAIVATVPCRGVNASSSSTLRRSARVADFCSCDDAWHSEFR